MLQHKSGVFTALVLFFSVILGLAGFLENLNAAEYELPHALSFGGDGAYIDLGVDAGDLGIEGNRKKTIEIWVYLHDFQRDEGIFSLGTTGAARRDFSLRVLDGEENRFRGQFWSDDIDFTYEAKNKWVHFAVTHDGETQRVYADGELVGEQDNELDTSTEQNLRVGWWRGDSYGTLDGTVRELRVWSSARSEAEITGYMHNSLSGDEDGLVGYWPMEEGEGETAYDKSPGENHVSISEASWTRAVISAEILDKPPERILPLLTEIAEEYSTANNLRIQAIRTLPELDLPAKDVKTPLLEILKDSEDADDIRLEIITVLNKFVDAGDKEVATALLGILKDTEDSNEVRRETIKVLEEAGPEAHERLADDPEAVESLNYFVGPESPPQMRASAGRILNAIGAGLPDKASGWPMWRYDAFRSAEPPFQLSEDLYFQWVRELPEPERAWPHQWDDSGTLDFDVSYTPVVKAGRVFVPSNVTDSVTAYHIEDGRKLWRFYADGPVRLAPAAWGGSVYFTSDDGHLYCVDAETGKLEWKFRGGPSNHRLLGNERVISFWGARGAPVVYEGSVYFIAGIWPNHGLFLYALDALTGEVEWVNDMVELTPIERNRGGVVPQGYIAVDADSEQLVVAGGRSAEARYDIDTGEVREPHGAGRRVGSYAVHAGGRGMVVNEMLRERVESVVDQIDKKVYIETDRVGDFNEERYLREEPDSIQVFYKLSAGQKLLFTTECGMLYCFGPEEREATEHPFDPAPLQPRSGEWADVAERLLDELGESSGYALMLGAGSGDLMRELLERSDLHLVIVEDDSERVRELREKLAGADLHGRSGAVVIEEDPVEFSVQPYLFSLIVSEDAESAGVETDAVQIESILDWLRPYGGTAWLGTGNASEMAEAITASGMDQVEAEAGSGYLLARRDGPLTGAGQWTHEHHDTSRTLKSQDELVRQPLGILWFGGPSNKNILPRHGQGPRPQIAGGRQVFLGVETLSARCVYTGRELWERELPGVGHPFTPERGEIRRDDGIRHSFGRAFIGSPLVTLEDAIYLRHEGDVYRLDPATGETSDKWTPPGRSVRDIYDNDDIRDYG